MIKNNLIGISGREGAGKSTIADYLAPEPKIYELCEYNNPWAYIMSVLYGWDYILLQHVVPRTTQLNEIRTALSVSNLYEYIWNMTILEAFDRTLNVLSKLDSEILNNVNMVFQAPVNDYKKQDEKGQFKQISLADPLKRICVPLSGLNFEILRGFENNYRKKREQPIRSNSKSWNNKKFPNMTGRQLLEFLGTECFRQSDPEFWIKIAERRINYYNSLGIRVILSDVRFNNEHKMLKKNNGVLFVVTRSIDDLSLTKQDQTQHISKWEFLTFINMSTDIIIVNDKKIEDLYTNIAQKFCL